MPAASPAVAVHTLDVSAAIEAAVNMLFATLKLPPFVQVTLGPVVTPTASVADKVDAAVLPDSTVKVAGLKVTVGAVVSVTTGGVIVPPDDPPPQAERSVVQMTTDRPNLALNLI